MLNDKSTTWMYILPFVEPKDMAAEDHKCVACSYAGFDLPRREGAEARHGEVKEKIGRNTQVEGGLDA
jgi:hypothetical protein